MNRAVTGYARGFTLLEMLVALSIFGLLAVMSYGGLASVLDLRSQTEEQSTHLASLQKAYMILQRDMEQIIYRPVRDQFGDELPPLVGDQKLEFTHGGWSNPLGLARSSLQRVTYAWEDRQLRRYVWWVLDRAQDSSPIDELLLDHVEDMQLRYLAGKEVWKEQWPDPIQGSGPDEAGETPTLLPAAVEISIQHEHFGEIVWLFRVQQ